MIGGGGFNLHHIFILFKRFEPKATPKLQKPRFVVRVFLKSPVIFFTH